MTRSIFISAFAVAALAVAAAPASAYKVSGKRWPAGTISYYTNVGAQNAEVQRAAESWNKEALGVTFVRLKSQSKAQLVIKYGSKGCGGLGTVGYYGPSFVGEIQLGRACRDAITRLTATHELGHVLGLGHEKKKCALMNPVGDISTGTPNRCSVRAINYWLANPIQTDDRNGARKLYAGSLGRATSTFASTSAAPAGPVVTLR
jgi:hypothetical protein